MAKGLSSGYLPISAVGVAGHIVEALRSVSGQFIHGYTYSGHPTAAKPVPSACWALSRSSPAREPISALAAPKARPALSYGTCASGTG